MLLVKPAWTSTTGAYGQQNIMLQILNKVELNWDEIHDISSWWLMEGRLVQLVIFK